ncbi:MAG: hypothetical protein RMK74_08760 [Myxococcales bacterium]|nr:hypothetical protein [Myxococcales bacterium]
MREFMLPAAGVVLQSATGVDEAHHRIGWESGGPPGRVVHASRPSAPDSAWTVRLVDDPGPGPVLAWAAAIGGRLMAVFQKTTGPCDPCDVDTYLGVLEPGTMSWRERLPQRGTWGAPNDSFIGSVSLLVRDGTAYVAAQWRKSVVTGSLSSSELRVYVAPDDMDVCMETVTSTSDMYAGTDGMQFTGASPVIAAGTAGRLHVLFLDIAAWHTADGANAVTGQLRLATRAQGGWRIAQLTEQRGQAAMPRPLEGFVRPSFVPSTHGRQFIVAAIRQAWDTGTIDNLDSPEARLELVTLRGHFALPD